MAKRKRTTFAQDADAAPYLVPRVGDSYLVDPATDTYKKITRVIREGTGPNARTFTVTDEARNLAWIRLAGTRWVDAKLHVDCGGWEGEPCLYAHVGELRQTTADAVMLAPEDLAVFERHYPESAA